MTTDTNPKRESRDETEPQMHRRHVLATAGGAGFVALAGCLGGGDDNGDDSNGDDNGTESNGTDNGTDTNGNGNETDSSGNGSDDGTENGTDSGNGTDDDDGTDDGNGADNGTADETRIEDVFQWSDSFVMEFTSEEASGTYRVNAGNMHITFTGGQQGQSGEYYLVDGDAYVITEGQCFIQSGFEDSIPLTDPPEPEDYPTVTASGRRTVDGEEVYVFDVENGEYLISVSTGYPVRFTSSTTGTVDFHSWGEVEPISGPDMNCQSF